MCRHQGQLPRIPSLMLAEEEEDSTDKGSPPPEKIGTSLVLTPIDDDNDEIYGTTRFGVFVVDLAAGKLTETEELGDRALFLGANASISIQASQFPSLKPNHIY
ncbi:hypothetical protein T459_10193 [Capsicum annuum]|uniref:KIB1-4 beta-propeller domain-containing protein n=1 Tax=Capsicum annuum TaxID=4072 RepID=A0A2G3A1H1_CAPAN|nr:hypothetical protein T459_10193 [Capsicum annuum]